MNKFKNAISALVLALVVVGCQSSRTIYKQSFGPNEKDEFAVLASFNQVFFFTLDCHDTNCEMRRCTDETYSNCPELLAECKNDELKLMFFTNEKNLRSETRICKNYEKTFLATIKKLGLTEIAKIKSSFEGSISKDDFAKAVNEGYRFDIRKVANDPQLTYEENLDVAKCVYNGPGAASLGFELDTDTKTIKLTAPIGQKYSGVKCLVPYTGKAVQLI